MILFWYRLFLYRSWSLIIQWLYNDSSIALSIVLDDDDNFLINIDSEQQFVRYDTELSYIVTTCTAYYGGFIQRLLQQAQVTVSSE